MFVNDLILNACVKTTEIFICEKILANAEIMVSQREARYDPACQQGKDEQVYIKSKGF
jgi:hypothetical protein